MLLKKASEFSVTKVWGIAGEGGNRISMERE